MAAPPIWRSNRSPKAALSTCPVLPPARTGRAASEHGTPIRAIVGDNPVEFVETFLQNYAEGQWINKERKRLIDAIDRIADNAP